MGSTTSAQVDFGIFGSTTSWGTDANCYAVVVSGPGLLGKAVTGCVFRLTGLSTNVPTVVAVTRTTLATDLIGPLIYPDLYTSVTVGKAIYAQVDNLEAGANPTSFIPNPNSSGTVICTADIAQMGRDQLCRVLPWLADTNLLASPDVPATQTVATTVQPYTLQLQGTGSCTLSGSATGVLNGLGAGAVATLTVPAAAGTLTLTYAGTVINSKLEPGPVASQFVPASEKQGTILISLGAMSPLQVGMLAQLDDGNVAGQRLQLDAPSTGVLRLYSAPGGTSQTKSLSLAVPHKVAIAFDQQNLTLVVDGEVVSTLPYTAPKGLRRLLFGSGTFARTLVASTRLPDSTLQAITS